LPGWWDRSPQDSALSPGLGEGGERAIDLRLAVRRHRRHAEAGRALGHRRRPDRLREYAAGTEGVAEAERRPSVADDDRDDVRVAAGLEAEGPEAGAKARRVPRERGASRGLGDDDVEGSAGGGHRRGRETRRVDETPRAVHEPVDQRPGARHVGARAAERLAERAEVDVDALADAVGFRKPGATRAEHARGVGL